MPLLEVRDLHVTFPVQTPLFHKKKRLCAVNGVTFSLDEGEILGLVGESGCGKSTLGRTIVRLETEESGSILLNGKDLTRLRGAELRKERRNFQMIFQDPYGSLNPRLTAGQSIDEVLRLHAGLAPTERRERAAFLLKRVGLNGDALDRYPHQFSGGQRQRIGIARALAAEPKFIVADEPVSALDVSVQAAIVNLLKDIQQEQGTAFLFIAHDLAVVEHISHRIMVMYLGRVMESGPSQALTSAPLHPYTRALMSAVPTLQPSGGKRIVLAGDVPSPVDPPSGCPFHPRCPKAKSLCGRELPPLTDCGNGRCCACFYPEEA